VAGVVNAFTDFENLCLMLEVMPHDNFAHLIDKEGPFEPLTACFYYCNIFCGLEFVHSHDLILRDLKPDNILVGHDGYLCLTDFGLAEKESEGAAWILIGTSGYMAPEIISNSRYFGPTVDWWASGVILYEMLARQLVSCSLWYHPMIHFSFQPMYATQPFCGSSEGMIFAKIMTLNYRWPDCQLGNSLKHFISRLLTFKPEKRLGFLGAAEVAGHPWLSHVDWIRMKSRTYQVLPDLSPTYPRDSINKPYSLSRPGPLKKPRYRINGIAIHSRTSQPWEI
jgi:serine/threonine protein kinase